MNEFCECVISAAFAAVLALFVAEGLTRLLDKFNGKPWGW